MICPTCENDKTLAINCKADNEKELIELWFCNICNDEFKVTIDRLHHHVIILPIITDHIVTNSTHIHL